MLYLIFALYLLRASPVVAQAPQEFPSKYCAVCEALTMQLSKHARGMYNAHTPWIVIWERARVSTERTYTWDPSSQTLMKVPPPGYPKGYVDDAVRLTVANISSEKERVREVIAFLRGPWVPFMEVFSKMCHTWKCPVPGESAQPHDAL